MLLIIVLLCSMLLIGHVAVLPVALVIVKAKVRLSKA